MAFDATIGSATANSYLTLAAANEYFAMRWDSVAWDALNDTQKEKALMAATRLIDRKQFRGEPVSTNQRLSWPRLDVPKIDAPGYGSYSSNFYTATELPQQLKDAVCEMAQNLISAAAAESAGRKISSWSSDDQAFTYESDGRSAYALPAEVTELLSGLTRSARLERA